MGRWKVDGSMAAGRMQPWWECFLPYAMVGVLLALCLGMTAG